MPKTLPVTKRTGRGKGPARRLRASGQVPAVIYGHGKENIDVAIDGRSFDKFLATLKSEAELVTLRVGDDANDEHLALIKELQYHPVSERIVHADFFEVNPDEQIHVTVPLHFVGTPVGVTDHGGLLEFLQRELEIISLPRHIPTVIDVDISGLGPNTVLHVAEVQLPENVITREDPRRGLVHVTTKTQREEAPAAGAEGAAAAPAAG